MFSVAVLPAVNNRPDTRASNSFCGAGESLLSRRSAEIARFPGKLFIDLGWDRGGASTDLFVAEDSWLQMDVHFRRGIWYHVATRV